MFKPKSLAWLPFARFRRSTPSKTTWALLAQTCVPARAVSMRAYTSNWSDWGWGTALQLKQPIYLESSLSIPDFPESLKHCCVKHLGLFQHIHTLISYNLKTRPKQNVLKCLEPLESVKARVTCKVSPVPKSSRPSRTTRRLHKA